MKRSTRAASPPVQDREAIHAPGAIQSTGSLLALDDAGQVVVWSADLDARVEAIGRDGFTLEDVLGADDAAALQPHVAAVVGRAARTVPLPASRRRALVHRNTQGLTLVEFEDDTLDDTRLVALLRRAQDTTRELDAFDTAADLRAALADAVRALTGFDDVTVSLDPCDDAPIAADPVHAVTDATADPVPLRVHANAADPAALDLRCARWRAATEADRSATARDVGASLSIVLRGEDGIRWTVACSHPTARAVDFDVRRACEHLVRHAAGRSARNTRRAREDARARVLDALGRFAESLTPDPRFAASLAARSGALRALIRCDAVVVAMDGQTPVIDGAALEPAAMAAWLASLPAGAGAPLTTTDLSSFGPSPQGFESALVVRDVGDLPTTIAWLRFGTPSGDVEPWSNDDVEAAHLLQSLILSPALRAVVAMQVQSEELDSLNTALGSTNEELERFAYVASHDLRAPLRAVRNIVDWLEEDEAERLSPTAREYLGLLSSRVDRMDRMMVDLLAYARAGREVMQSEAVDLDALLKEIDEDLSRPIGIRIVHDALPRLHAPRVPLRQILLNLIGNAIKHHDREKGRIVVTARRDGAAWILAVEDDGPGIPYEHRDRVFDMFTTLSSRDLTEGSGIGLALVRRYARSLGGDARIEGVEPRGTRVIVRLSLGDIHE